MTSFLKSPAVPIAEKIRIKNRRKMYLDRNPSYFTAPDLELADPLLYDRCIRKFQSAAEREADGRSKGYSGVLEADLYRSEAKLAALKAELPAESVSSGNDTEDTDEAPQSKEEGYERWKFEMTMRFLKGEDEDFEYREVDESEEFDVVEGKEEEERWFDEEEPGWVGEGGQGGSDRETGVQDF